MAAPEASGTLAFDVDLLPDRLGFNVNAMLWLTMPTQHLAAVALQIAAHDEVATTVAISGRNNLLAVAICRDADDLYRCVSDWPASTTFRTTT
jgi:hypothetical protein